MRATSRDVVATAFTLLIGLFVVIAMYMFGTGIFKAGARIGMSETNTDQLCGCVSETIKENIGCVGKTFACTECKKDSSGKCSSVQSVKFESASPIVATGINVYASVFKAGDDAKEHVISVYVNDPSTTTTKGMFGGSLLLGEIKGSCAPGSNCYRQFLFSQPREVKEVRAVVQGSGYSLMRLAVTLNQK